MLPARAGCHNNQAGFVILGSVADDLKRLTIEWMMWVFYRDGWLRIVGIMRLFPGGDGSVMAVSTRRTGWSVRLWRCRARRDDAE